MVSYQNAIECYLLNFNTTCTCKVPRNSEYFLFMMCSSRPFEDKLWVGLVGLAGRPADQAGRPAGQAGRRAGRQPGNLPGPLDQVDPWAAWP